MHIRRHTPGQEIFTRRREDVNEFAVFWEEAFVLNIGGITATSPPIIDRRSLPMRKSILPLSIQTICS
jgi:hypothetical protein